MILPLNISGNIVPIDGYAYILSRWGQRALTNATARMHSDIYWAVHSRNLFGFYQSESISCSQLLTKSGISSVNALIACSNAGWDIGNSSSWMTLQVWVIAASKSTSSQEYQYLLKTTGLSASDLNSMLYDDSTSSIKYGLNYIQDYISQFYECLNTVCTYDEMLWKQWSQSLFTNKLTEYLFGKVTPSLSLYSWLPSHYDQPIEWLWYNPELELSYELTKQLINFDMFLSPNYVKLFFHSYFEGDLQATALEFNLPSELYVKGFYSYFQNIVPGSGLFITQPYQSWVMGFMHPFLAFLFKNNIFQGGNPLASPFFTIGGNSTDQLSWPRTVMNSGKSSIKKTRDYYQYYGSRTIMKFGATLCLFCTNAVKYTYIPLWPANHTLNCTDGGKFENGLSKHKPQYAYIDIIKKIVKLKYQSTEDYYGLTTYKFALDTSDFATAAVVPENAGYNQFAYGINGFYNATSSFGFPTFLSLPHFYEAEETAVGMAEFYKYTPDNYLSTRIYRSDKDIAYLLINVDTGASLKLRFKLMFNVGVYRDYYFNQIAQPGGTRGLYLPYFIIKRESTWSESMVNKHFGALIEAYFLEKIFFYLGILAGAFFFQIAFMIAVFVRRNRRRMHHKRLSLAIRKSLDKKK